MKKTVFTIGAVLLITSGFVSESFGASGGGSTPPPSPGPATGTGTAPALLSGADKVSGTKTNVDEMKVELLGVPSVQVLIKAIEGTSAGFCINHGKMSYDKAAHCALKDDQPSAWLRLEKLSEKSGEAKKYLCAVAVKIPDNFYKSNAASMKNFFGKADANKRANSQWEQTIRKCYKLFS